MAMRSQVYAWDLYGGKSNTSSGAAGLIQATFTGGIPAVGSTLATTAGVEYLINSSGNGYSVNDIITFVGGGQIRVTVAPGGVIEDAEIITPGGGYVIGQTLVIDNVAPAGGTGLDMDLGAIGTGFTAGADNATTTVVSATGATGGTIRVASVTPRGAATSMTSDANSQPGTGTNYMVGDTFITGGANGLAGTVTQTGIGWSASGNSNVVELGKPFSIFIGGKGNNISIPAATTATQFVVVENFGCTPSVFLPGSGGPSAGTWVVGQAYRGKQVTSSVAGPRAYLQFTINTTGYFKDPDGVVRDGIPGTAAPYPVSEQFNACADRKQPPVYVLPGQKWDLQMVIYSGASTTSTGITRTTGYATEYGQLNAFFKYTLYDGADALIAMKMLEMGIKITPQNIDKYKQSLVDNQNKQYVMEKDE